MDIGFLALSRLAFGYWEGQPLFALVDLNIPDVLSLKPLTAAEIAHAVDASPEATERLLNAAVALKLLQREGNYYGNGDIANRFLTQNGEHSLLHWVRVMGRWTAPWAKLHEAIRTGSAVEPQSARLGTEAAYMRDFILGMHEYARRSSDTLVPFVDPAARLLVDVGGGGGTYAVALCRALPELQAEVLDLEPVLAITREIIEGEGFVGRIGTRVVNYRADPFGRDADVVLFSNVLHQETREICVSMMQRASEALRQNGTILIQGYFLNEDRVSPTFVTLHNLSALTLWEGGRSWTVPEMTTMMCQAGFSDVQATPLGSSGTTILSGRRS